MTKKTASKQYTYKKKHMMTVYDNEKHFKASIDTNNADTRYKQCGVSHGSELPCLIIVCIDKSYEIFTSPCQYADKSLTTIQQTSKT